jgi:hypothetical protein
MGPFLQALELTPDVFGNRSLIVVEEGSGVDGTFVLHSLLAEFNRMGGGSVETKSLLVLNHTTTHHWAAIAAKLGWNLHQARGTYA